LQSEKLILADWHFWKIHVVTDDIRTAKSLVFAKEISGKNYLQQKSPPVPLLMPYSKLRYNQLMASDSQATCKVMTARK